MMTTDTDHDALDAALRRAGSSWNAAQAHGLITGRLAVRGASAGDGTLSQVLVDVSPDNALRKECESLLTTLILTAHAQLAERLSEFTPLLPDDHEPTTVRTEALAHWSEGYLHGLVGDEHSDALRERLAAEPIAGIIKDLLAITRASVEDNGNETDEAAYAEVVEYVRVVAQLVYEELAAFRPQTTA